MTYKGESDDTKSRWLDVGKFQNFLEFSERANFSGTGEVRGPPMLDTFGKNNMELKRLFTCMYVVCYCIYNNTCTWSRNFLIRSWAAEGTCFGVVHFHVLMADKLKGFPNFFRNLHLFDMFYWFLNVKNCVFVFFFILDCLFILEIIRKQFFCSMNFFLD